MFDEDVPDFSYRIILSGYIQIHIEELQNVVRNNDTEALACEIKFDGPIKSKGDHDLIVVDTHSCGTYNPSILFEVDSVQGWVKKSRYFGF